MTFKTLLYLGSGVAFVGFALGTLCFLAWALIGRGGEPRSRRLRLALSSAVLFAASFVSAIALFHLVLLPTATWGLRPGFRAPYAWQSDFLVAAVPVALCASAIFLIRAMYRPPGARMQAAWLPAAYLLLALPLYGASYALIYRVQVPALDRYVLIENREWKTHLGDPAPDISVVMLDGTERRLSDLRGKLVLVNLFATWCGPCMHELPHLEELWHELENDDRVAMLVIDRDEPEETVAEFLAERGFTFSVALDANAEAFHAFAESGIPRTYLIGRDGTILFQTVGFADDLPVYQRELATLRETIERELAAIPQP
ncbi:MAG: TlpA family protein disulfide reductase [Planctomycetota bacterium]|nr:MAG: TlpA family protein disulfide reductase [Planctomycetota bacterium]